MAQLALNVKKKLPRDGGMANLAGGGGSGSGGGPGKATSMNGLPTTGAYHYCEVARISQDSFCSFHFWILAIFCAE